MSMATQEIRELTGSQVLRSDLPVDDLIGKPQPREIASLSQSLLAIPQHPSPTSSLGDTPDV